MVGAIADCLTVQIMMPDKIQKGLKSMSQNRRKLSENKQSVKITIEKKRVSQEIYKKMVFLRLLSMWKGEINKISLDLNKESKSQSES